MNDKAPTVSIIMNCYNGDRYLKEAIDSVYSQTFCDWEIIFWDNASTDNSPNIANSYDRRLKYYSSDKTTPLGEARSYAIQKASGKYIAFLDCDDLYLSHKLEKQIDLMEKSDFLLCYGSVSVIDENGNEIRKLHMKNNSGYLFEKLLRKYEVNMQTVILLRSALNELGFGFESQFIYCPDYNLFMNIASNYRIGVIKDIIVKYRVSPDSLSRKTLHKVSEEIKASLDDIFSKNPKLEIQFPSAKKFAYNKLRYYNAINLINKNKFKEARKELFSILFHSPKYLALYMLTLLGLSKQNIFSITRR